MITQKFTKTASELPFDGKPPARIAKSHSALSKELQEKTLGLAPSLLIKEIEHFVKRNKLIKKRTLSLDHCCPNCLKAHIRKKSDELNINERVMALLLTSFDGEIGHLGYYTDQDKLIKL